MTESLEKILADRNKTHGNWDDQAACAQALKKTASEHTNHPEKPAFMQEALDMIRHKESRIEIGDMWEPEHWKDIAGYATCVVRILERAQTFVEAKLADEAEDDKPTEANLRGAQMLRDLRPGGKLSTNPIFGYGEHD